MGWKMVLEIIGRFDSQTSSVFCFLLSRPVGGGSAEEVKPLLVFLSLMLNHHLIPQNAHFTVQWLYLNKSEKCKLQFHAQSSYPSD